MQTAMYSKDQDSPESRVFYLGNLGRSQSSSLIKFNFLESSRLMRFPGAMGRPSRLERNWICCGSRERAYHAVDLSISGSTVSAMSECRRLFQARRRRAAISTHQQPMRPSKDLYDIYAGSFYSLCALEIQQEQRRFDGYHPSFLPKAASSPNKGSGKAKYSRHLERNFEDIKTVAHLWKASIWAQAWSIPPGNLVKGRLDRVPESERLPSSE